MLAGKEEFFTAEELEKKEFMNVKPIEHLYLTAMKKSPTLGEYIKTADEPLINAIKHIELTTYKENDNFKLTFYFAEDNGYIEEKQLAITFVTNDEGQEIKSDNITWLEGKDLTKKKITKKQKNKKTGQQRTTTKVEKQDSFFNIFANLKNDEDDEDQEDENDEEFGGSLFAENEDILQIIKENIVQYSVPAFFGVSIPELENDGEGMMGDDEDSDEDDDESEEESPKKKGSKSKKKASGSEEPTAKGDDPKQQECKQN